MKYSFFFLIFTSFIYVVHTQQKNEIDTEKLIHATTKQLNTHNELMAEMVLDKQVTLQHFLNEPVKQKYYDINTAAFIVANAPEEIIRQLNEQQQLNTQSDDQDSLTDFIKKNNKNLLETSDK